MSGFRFLASIKARSERRRNSQLRSARSLFSGGAAGARVSEKFLKRGDCFSEENSVLALSQAAFAAPVSRPVGKEVHRPPGCQPANQPASQRGAKQPASQAAKAGKQARIGEGQAMKQTSNKQINEKPGRQANRQLGKAGRHAADAGRLLCFDFAQRTTKAEGNELTISVVAAAFCCSPMSASLAWTTAGESK